MKFDPQLWQATKGYRGRIFLAIVLGLVSLTLGIARFVLLGWALARLFDGARLDALAGPFGAIILVVVGRLALEHARAAIAHRTAARIQDDLRLRIFDKLVSLGPSWLATNRSGNLVLSTIDGVEQLQTFFGQFLPQLAIALIAPLLIFFVLAWWDVPVAGVLAVSAVLALLAPIILKRIGERSTMWRVNAFKAFGDEFLDGVQGLPTLKAFGQGKTYAERLAARAHALAEGTMFVVQASLMSRALTDLVTAGGAAAAIALGAWRVTTGAMSVEALLIVLMAGTEVFRPLRDLRSLLHRGMTANAAAVDIKNVLNAVPPKPLIEGDARPQLQPSITFRNVSYAYDARRGGVLENVSFDVRAGEKIAIVGHSGAGKSTLVRLLLRFADPTAGVIELGGREVSRMPADHVRDLISVVQQDTYLFYGSVEDNLRIACPQANRDQIEAAARAANAHAFIEALPQGYSTMIGERGLTLSGGQRQRIAIARAVLRDAPLLILDEALSAVDAENESEIQATLDRLSVGRTTVVIAHRLSSVIGADRIIVLDKGRIASVGSHHELIGRKGIYRDLMAQQIGDAFDSENISRLDRNESVPIEIDRTPATCLERPASEGASPTLGFFATVAVLFRFIIPWRRQLVWTVVSGVGRVYALIAVSVLSALSVAAIKMGIWPGRDLIWMAGAVPLAAFLQWNESWRSHDMAYRLLAEMRVDLFKQLERLAPAYLLQRRSGDLVALGTQDVETIEYFFAHVVAPAMVAILVPATIIVSLLALAWPVAIVLLPFLIYGATAPVFNRARIDKVGNDARSTLGELNAFVLDTIQGMGELVAFRAIERRRETFAHLVANYQRLRIALQTDVSLQTAKQEALTALSGVTVAVVGTILVDHHTFERGLIPLITLLAAAAFTPVTELALAARQLADSLASARRVQSVYAEPVKIVDGRTDLPKARGGSSVTFDDVCFSYENSAGLALDHVSFEVSPGATLAIVGASGAGKSTIANLLLRFWDPTSGEVCIDGVDLKSVPLDQLRNRIALVAQDTYLFNTTLEDNIRLAKPDASHEELLAAIDQAALSDLVAALPEGLATPVGERGLQLSGGQRQRIAIARAFLKNAPILILDEATSHLDAESERHIQASLAALMHGRTTIAIAHRLSTIRTANQILLIDEGRIVETGTHTALIAQSGAYARLLLRQIVGTAKINSIAASAS